MKNEELVSLIKDGVEVADNMLQLWQQNQGLIAKIASIYSGYENIEDLKQQGYIGLCNAVEGYKPQKGTNFTTYAYFWIQQSIERYICDCGTMIRMPEYARASVMKYKKYSAAFLKEFGRTPSNKEIGLFMGINQKQVRQLKQDVITATVASLDELIDSEAGRSTIVDTVAGNENIEELVIEKIQQEELKEVIWLFVDKLPEQQGEILRRRFQREETLIEIGQTLGMSAERIRQMQNEGLRRLRGSRSGKILKMFLPGKAEHIAYTGGVKIFKCTWTSSTERAAIYLYEHNF